MTPDQYTNQEFFLDVGEGHQLYVQDWGNKAAKTPILFLHGGPGGGLKDRHKGSFDPAIERVIFHDQRGCGKSLPYGSLEHNTTQALVADIEKIADRLGLKEFIVTGGSWGSCLALAYALEHPKRIKAMVLHGIFTGSKSEIHWLDNGQFKTFFPDVWEAYRQRTPASQRDNPSSYHFKRILGEDEQAVKESGYAYECLEGGAMALDDRFAPDSFEDYDPSGIKIEVHYMAHGCFMPDRHILENAQKLTMPIWLVQGRYDNVCPPITAYELDKVLPSSHLIMTVSGHKTEHESWNLLKTILLQLTEEK